MQPIDTLGEKAAPPLADGHCVHTKASRDILILQAFPAGEDDTRPRGQGRRGLAPPGLRAELGCLGFRQHQPLEASYSQRTFPPYRMAEPCTMPWDRPQYGARLAAMTNFGFGTLERVQSDRKRRTRSSSLFDRMIHGL